jgi:hypothetical protein
MQRLPDGQWQATLHPLLKSLIHYKYVIRGGANTEEVTTRGGAVRDRTLWVPSDMVVEDHIAAWAGDTYTGPTGRIVGTVVDRESGEPLQDVLVSAAGMSAFSDGEGAFDLEGVEPGLHNLTAVSTDGSTVPFQQGAAVAGGATTPARLALNPAIPVQVTFEVEIPENTGEGMPLRMAGDLRAFGDRFGDIPGQTGGAVELMPTLVQVDHTHYILIADLFGGTDFRYKYTLGDGLWNAERDLKGFLTTRQLIVPETDTVVHDVVGSWTTPGKGAVTFRVQTPDSGDIPVGLQLMPAAGFQPLPMRQDSPNMWSYVLYGPLDIQGSIPYRYCRMADCSRVSPGGTGESIARPREVTPKDGPSALDDKVSSWVWQTGPSPLPDMPAAEIQPRPDFEAGVEFQPDPDPNAITLANPTPGDIAEAGANAVTLTPAWSLGLPNASPLMAFNPANGPFASEIEKQIASAHGLGLEVALRPTLAAPSDDIGRWWEESTRDAAWWNVWFEEYRSFLLSYARVAADGGADKIILDGSEVGPSFPRGVLQDGSPAGTPPDAERRWRQIIEDVRGMFPGTLAFELELGENLEPPPTFVDAVDQIHIEWHPPLDAQGTPSTEELRAEAGRWMDEALLAQARLAEKPLVLSLEYPSVEGGDHGCLRDPNGGCTPASALALGALPDPAPSPDLTTQALVYDAVLMEAYSRPQIRGVYARDYNASVALQDLSTSVRGKPAQVVLWYWYSRITGKITP